MAITTNTTFDSRLAEEFCLVDLAYILIAVNEFEAAVLRDRYAKPVRTIGHHLIDRPQNLDWTERSGLLFVGALHDATSPNYDSLLWFLDNVWPRIRAARPGETLRIAGFARPDIPTDALRRDGVTYLGRVDDLTEEYRRARVFVAPTRFAAGVPFKVHEALSFGLPVVSSRLIQNQLDHADVGGSGVIPATVNDKGVAFAQACVALLTDADLWIQLHREALAYIRRYCSPALLSGLINALVRDLGQTDH